MRKHENLITDRTARLPGECATQAEIRHAAQFAPGSVTPAAQVIPADHAATNAVAGLNRGRKAELRARGRVRQRAGQMNRTEKAFSDELRRMQAAGEILWWQWDCVTLRLADRTHYRPDFAVLYADGMLRLVDTKGTTKKSGEYKPFCEEDAKMKIKVVAEQFPIVFAIAYRLPLKSGGGWKVEDV